MLPFKFVISVAVLSTLKSLLRLVAGVRSWIWDGTDPDPTHQKKTESGSDQKDEYITTIITHKVKKIVYKNIFLL